MKKKFKQVLMGCNNLKLSDCSMVTDTIIDLLLIVDCSGFNCKKWGKALLVQFANSSFLLSIIPLFLHFFGLPRFGYSIVLSVQNDPLFL